MLKTWPMLKSLLWKELRELLPLISITIAAEIMWIAALLHFSDDGRHAARSGWPVLYMITVLFAVAAGSWQMWRESYANQFQFLLHRPLNRDGIFLAKIGFGVAAVIVIVALPQLLFAIWAEDSGAWRGYVVIPSWQLFAGILLFYLGAALSGLRPGRWYGSRFLPLLAGILLFVVLQVMGDLLSSKWNESGSGGWESNASLGWLATLGLALLFEIGFAIAMLHVARTRDYS